MVSIEFPFLSHKCLSDDENQMERGRERPSVHFLSFSSHHQSLATSPNPRDFQRQIGWHGKRVMLSNCRRMTLLWVHLFFTLCCVRSVIFPKMMIYKTGCSQALDLIYQEVKYVMVKNNSVSFLFLWSISAAARPAAHTVSAIEINGRQVGLWMLRLGEHPLQSCLKPTATHSLFGFFFCTSFGVLGSLGHQDDVNTDSNEFGVQSLIFFRVCKTVLRIHADGSKSHFSCTYEVSVSDPLEDSPAGTRMSLNPTEKDGKALYGEMNQSWIFKNLPITCTSLWMHLHFQLSGEFCSLMANSPKPILFPFYQIVWKTERVHLLFKFIRQMQSNIHIRLGLDHALYLSAVLNVQVAVPLKVKGISHRGLLRPPENTDVYIMIYNQ